MRSAMKSIGILFLILVAAFGQVRSGGVHTFGSATGFGNVVYPGTGHAPPIGSGARIGARIGGGGVRPRVGGAVVYVPYAVGVPAYYYGDPGEAPAAAYPQQQGAPTV